MQPLITLMPPPPAATFIALHPEDNNIIAIGMEDSSIKIYNFLTQSVVASEYSSWNHEVLLL